MMHESVAGFTVAVQCMCVKKSDEVNPCSYDHNAARAEVSVRPLVLVTSSFY